MSSSVKCGNCGSNDLECEPSRGDTYCTQCGNVIDKSSIVSEIQFQEGSHGSALVVGRRCDTEAESGSRQRTLWNAKNTITTVCDKLSLNNHFIDMAFRFYKMALHYRVTNGRKHTHVIAACVYITCRTEGTSHMLLDLSDVSRVNVYELGRTYLKLSATLCITIPAIDPSLYVIRFAQDLHLGEKGNKDVERLRNKIIGTANRLVQRMKRDWMHYGRRPSGLCGAAILVAARLNDIHCDIKDVIKIVKVCETTIRKRLFEFSETPSSYLTVDEFMTMDFEGEEDPPCYKAAKKREELSKIDNKQQLDDEMSELQKLIEKDLEKSRKKLKNHFTKHFPLESNHSCSEELAVQQFIDDNTVQTIEDVMNNKDTNDNYDEYIKSLKALRPTAKSLGITQTVDHINSETFASETMDEDINSKTDELDLTDINDQELDGYLLNNEEVNAKTSIWTAVHSEYLAEMKQKDELKARDDEERREKEASGDIQPKKSRKKKKKAHIQAKSADEAIVKMLRQKKISNKINYDVMKSLNQSSSDKQTKKIDTSLKPINNTQSHEPKPNLAVKRLTSLKHSSHASIGSLKSQLFTQLNSKRDINVSAIKASETECEKNGSNSMISLASVETKTHTIYDNSIKNDNIVNEEEDDDYDYSSDDCESKFKNPFCCEESSNHSDDNIYYNDYDEYL